MRICFVAIGCEQLAISQLSAICKKAGHEVTLAFARSLFNDHFNLRVPWLSPLFDDREDCVETAIAARPDVLAFSVLTSTYQWCLEVARRVKEASPHTVVVFGGVHPSAVPERVLRQPEVDVVCVGEGDEALPQLLAQLAAGATAATLKPIANLWIKRPDGGIARGEQNAFIQDLDSLPFYDKEIWLPYLRGGDLYLTMASRGCPFRCTFCFNNFFAKLNGGRPGKYVRQRSVEHVLAELRHAKATLAKHGQKINVVAFEDDIFTVNKAWLKEFLPAYKREIGRPFQCLTHPKYMDEEVASWLHEAGCEWVQIGVQTMDEDFKVNELKRYERSAQVEKAMAAMLKHGLKPKVDHMLALPGEPDGAQEKARELYVKHTPARIQTFWTQFLPGTEMVQQALSMKIMTPQEVERLNDGIDFDFFHAHARWLDARRVRVYKAYETLFKLLPLMPRFLRGWLSVRMFLIWPHTLTEKIGFFVDTVMGLLQGNPEHRAYARHYVSFFMVDFARRVRRCVGLILIRRCPAGATPAKSLPPWD